MPTLLDVAVVAPDGRPGSVGAEDLLERDVADEERRDAEVEAGEEEHKPREDADVINVFHEDTSHRYFAWFRFDWRTLKSFLGPALLMSIGFLDPGNLESDLQNGAYTKYQILWVLMYSTLVGLFFQVLSARLGVTTGKDLSQHCKENYAPRTAFLIWMMTELAIVGSDVQEIVGSAVALQILFGLPLWLGSLLTVLDTFLLMMLQNSGIRKMEIAFSIFIAIMMACFFFTLFSAGFSLRQFGQGLALPSIPSYGVLQTVGTVGAVIMPHNLYLHSSLVTSRRIDRKRPREVAQGIKYNTIESSISLTVTFLINAAIVSTFAISFFEETCARRTDGPLALVDGECTEIGLRDSGRALERLLGSAAKYVWAVGLLCSGQASTVTSTLAGSIVMDGFFQIRVPRWKRLLITRSVALVPALVVGVTSTASGSSRIDDRVNEMLNVLQSLQLPFALLPLLRFTTDVRVMGKEFVNGPRAALLGSAFAALVLSINAVIVAERVRKHGLDSPSKAPFVAVLVLAYVTLVAVISKDFFTNVLETVRGGNGEREREKSSRDEARFSEHHGNGSSRVDVATPLLASSADDRDHDDRR